MSESFVTVEEPPHALINDFVRGYFHADDIFNIVAGSISVTGLYRDFVSYRPISGRTLLIDREQLGKGSYVTRYSFLSVWIGASTSPGEARGSLFDFAHPADVCKPLRNSLASGYASAF
jgi:hypothetical protein